MKLTGFIPWSLLHPPMVRIIISTTEAMSRATTMSLVSLQIALSRLGWMTA